MGCDKFGSPKGFGRGELPATYLSLMKKPQNCNKRLFQTIKSDVYTLYKAQ